MNAILGDPQEAPGGHLEPPHRTNLHPLHIHADASLQGHPESLLGLPDVPHVCEETMPRCVLKNNHSIPDKKHIKKLKCLGLVGITVRKEFHRQQHQQPPLAVF